ncbi:hypothetical protein OHS59_22185 [Streptomyces sp. NBC_00414]|uniref:hypothetical protein n=1 Tax=Streptomyces sp. NBC_00414 TaxID=2975739 RepID=UPI002E1F2942
MTSAACGSGGGDGDGYVAVQRPSSSAGAVAPTGDVELVPLESADAPKGTAGEASSAPADGGARSSAGTDAGSDEGGDGTGGSSLSGSSGAHGSGRTSPSSGGGDGAADAGGAGSAGGTGGSSGAGGAEGSTPGPGGSAGPAVLAVGDPEREPADRRWCEKVTVGFHNTGGTAVRSGTVTFGTHIIGALGIDWATVESAEWLPVPIAPGSRMKRTWTVCVDAWRVPLGMHVETRDLSVRWE